MELREVAEQPDLMGSLLVGKSEIAELARVRRPVVAMWIARHRPKPEPFPSPVVSTAGRELYRGVDVADWIAARNLGNNPALREDLAAHAVLQADPVRGGSRGNAPTDARMIWSARPGDWTCSSMPPTVPAGIRRAVPRVRGFAGTAAGRPPRDDGRQARRSPGRWCPVSASRRCWPARCVAAAELSRKSLAHWTTRSPLTTSWLTLRTH